MSNEKTKRTFSAKAVAILMVLVLVLGGVMGGTMAWLVTNTDPVVNTFTYGDIDITLTESEGELADNIREYLKNKEKALFTDLFSEYNKSYIVVTFMSILELAKEDEVILRQEVNFD